MALKSTYKESGVDVVSADAWVEILQSYTKFDGEEALISGIGDYASVYAINESECVALSCDGVGTKLLWTLEGLGEPEELAKDLFAMNANDVLCVGARPRLFLDYLAVGSRSLLRKGALLDRLIKGLIKTCRENSSLLVGGETAQLPDLYPDNKFDLAGFSLGFMEKSQYFDINQVNAGDSVWGLPSSGPHSNGYTWLRKLFHVDKDSDFICQHLMQGTRVYVNDLLSLREVLKDKYHLDVLAAYHMTGSGIFQSFKKTT